MKPFRMDKKENPPAHGQSRPLSPLRFLRRFLLTAALLLAGLAAAVFCLDPFYHYHKPWFGLTAVLTDKEYQCIGTLRTFDYDSLIVGSSVVENNDNRWYDESFGCHTIKAVRSYGATADLCYLLDAAHESHTMRYVFYNIDPSSLSAEPKTTYEPTGAPMYLYDKNPLNDYHYWFNKDVLFEKIPYMVMQSLTGYDPNLSYNWAQWKTFGRGQILANYARTPDVSEPLPADRYAPHLSGNLALLEREVAVHPETEYYFFFPPYSILWWDMANRSGEIETTLYNEETAMRALLAYDNVRIFMFQDRLDITANLDNYLDVLHFSPAVNAQMCAAMAAGECEVTADTVDETMAALRAYAETVLTEEIPPLEGEFRYAEETGDENGGAAGEVNAPRDDAVLPF